MRVAFHNPNVSIRGTFAAMVDYAVMNRNLLGNESTLLVRRSRAQPYARELPDLTQGLPVVFYETPEELERAARDQEPDFFYEISPGQHHTLPRLACPAGVHAVFPHGGFFGERFLYISPWLARVMTSRSDRHVPFPVRRYESGESWRSALGIPKAARVFGRHGGWDTFNIPFVHRVVAEHARKFPEDHFVFLNTQPVPGASRRNNVHYLPATTAAAEKARFLATCDAMLHARWHGETYGLAVGEFAVLGKPVITFGGSRERAHLDLLGERGLVYTDQDSLRRILKNFRPGPVWGTGYEPHADPHAVMALFQKRFLEDAG